MLRFTGRLLFRGRELDPQFIEGMLGWEATQFDEGGDYTPLGPVEQSIWQMEFDLEMASNLDEAVETSIAILRPRLAKIHELASRFECYLPLAVYYDSAYYSCQLSPAVCSAVLDVGIPVYLSFYKCAPSSARNE